MHATFKLIGPDGLVYNSEGPVFGVAMSVSGGMQQSIISGEGRWQYVIYGELEGFEFDINWTLKRLPDEDE